MTDETNGRARRRPAALPMAVLCGILAAVPGPTLGAQIISVRDHREPVVFTSASIGWLRLSTIDDGSTASSWAFGSAVQYRGTLELAVGRQSTLGVAASWARPPLSYYDNTGCLSGCDAHASVWFTGIAFHIGGSEGAYQIIDANAGVMGYSGFRGDAGGSLGPSGTDTDLSFGIGYGIGYGISRNTQVQLVGEYQTSLHQHTGLPGGANTTNEQYTMRIGLRYGIGSKRRGM